MTWWPATVKHNAFAAATFVKVAFESGAQYKGAKNNWELPSAASQAASGSNGWADFRGGPSST